MTQIRDAARRGRVGTVPALLLALVLAPAGVTAAQLDPFLSGLLTPVFITGARDGTDRLFVLEQGGIIKVVQPGSTTPSVFMDITDRVLSGGERGLLGLAFHPEFSSTRRFYVYYTRKPDGALVTSEFTVPLLTPNAGDKNTEHPLLTVPHPEFGNHNGGMIAFGPDGMLYIGVGDGGGGNDRDNHAQNIEDLLGKILRIDVDTGSAPPDNPFVGTAGRDEIYAVGFRNPFRFGFDRATGKLVVGDVGQNAMEEIDIVQSGKNYGWRVFEGTRCTGLDQALCARPSRYVKPIAEYPNPGAGCAVTGGYVYRGTADVLRLGTYVFSDFCAGELRTLAAARRGEPITPLLGAGFGVSSFGEDDAGELYVVNIGSTSQPTGTVRKLGNGCAFAVDATRLEGPSAGFMVNVQVTSPAGCRWRAVSNVDWISVKTAFRSQSGQKLLTVAPNPTGQPRTGTVAIAGHNVTVIQQ